MRTTIEADLLPEDLSLADRKTTPTSRDRLNSNQSEEDSVLNDKTFIPSSSSSVLPSPNSR